MYERITSGERFSRGVQLARLLYLVPLMNILRWHPWTLLSPVLSGLFGFWLMGWLVGPVLAADVAPRVSSADRFLYVTVGCAAWLTLSMVRGLLGLGALALGEAWQNLVEIIPQGTRLLVTCGVLKRAVDPGGLLLLWMMGPIVGYWYGSGVGRSCFTCVGVSLALVLCRAGQYIVAIAAIRAKGQEIAIAVLGIGLAVAGLAARTESASAGVWDCLPLNAARLVLLGTGEASAAHLLVLGIWVLGLYTVMVRMLSRTPACLLRDVAFGVGTCWMPAWLEAARVRVGRAVAPKARYSAFANFIRYGVLAASRSRSMKDSILPEGVFLAAIALVLAFQQDGSEFRYLLLYLACSPCLILSKVLLGDLANNLWLVRLSGYSVRRALAGHGVGVCAVGIASGLALVAPVYCTAAWMGRLPAAEGGYAQVMFVIWVTTFLAPLSVSWGMWARCRFVVVDAGTQERGANPKSYSFMLYVLMVLLPGGIGLQFLQDTGMGVLILYVLLGGYWGVVLFSHIALSKCDRTLVVQ